MLQEAYDICKKYDNHMIKYVSGIYANSLLDQIGQESIEFINNPKMSTHSNYEEHQKRQLSKTKQAAQLFYESDISFEQVVLNFQQKRLFNGL